MKSENICPGVIGRPMYAKTTLQSMKKKELIELPNNLARKPPTLVARMNGFFG